MYATPICICYTVFITVLSNRDKFLEDKFVFNIIFYKCILLAFNVELVIRQGKHHGHPHRKRLW